MTLFHNGSFHPNNTIINATEIGEGTMALFCFTKKSNCCSEVFGLSGEWYFPNGSAVEKELNGGALYRNRGPSVICLNQKNTFLSPPGIFRCEIPLENGTNQSLYAGLYPTNRGKRECVTLPYSLVINNSTTYCQENQKFRCLCSKLIRNPSFVSPLMAQLVI